MERVCESSEGERREEELEVQTRRMHARKQDEQMRGGDGWSPWCKDKPGTTKQQQDKKKQTTSRERGRQANTEHPCRSPLWRRCDYRKHF